MHFLHAVLNASTLDVPIVATVIEGFAAFMALYLIRLVLRNDKKTDKLLIAWFGDPDSKIPNGGYRKLGEVADSVARSGEDFRVHVASEAKWQQGIKSDLFEHHNEVQRRLHEMEKRLPPKRHQQ